MWMEVFMCLSALRHGVGGLFLKLSTLVHGDWGIFVP